MQRQATFTDVFPTALDLLVSSHGACSMCSCCSLRIVLYSSRLLKLMLQKLHRASEKGTMCVYVCVCSCLCGCVGVGACGCGCGHVYVRINAITTGD